MATWIWNCHVFMLAILKLPLESYRQVLYNLLEHLLMRCHAAVLIFQITSVPSLICCSLMSPDDLQDLLQHYADQRGETAVHGCIEKAKPGIPPETRVKKEDL